MKAALAETAKAIVAGLVTGLGSVAAAAADDGVISSAEWWMAASLAAGAAYAVWQTPNADPEP